MKLTEVYWTSASNLNCKSKYMWCSSKVEIYKEIAWGAGQPNYAGNTEWCSHISFKPGADNLTDLHDFTCSTAKKYICEVK